MPGRGNKKARGSTRGRRGGRGGRGGSSRGRIINHNRARGNKGKSSHSEYNSSAQHQSLFDPDSLWMPSGEMAQAGHNYGRRAYGKFTEEIEYTAQHQDRIMSRKFRDRPMVFVKAKEMYNPNELLYKLTQNKQEDPFRTVIDEEFKSISLDSDNEEEESVIEWAHDKKDSDIEDSAEHSHSQHVIEAVETMQSTDEITPDETVVVDEEEEEEEESIIESVTDQTNSDSGDVVEEDESQIGSNINGSQNTGGVITNTSLNEGISKEKVSDYSPITQSNTVPSHTVEREQIKSASIPSNSVRIASTHVVEEPFEEVSEDELEIFIDDPNYTDEQNIMEQNDVTEDEESQTGSETEKEYGFLAEDYEFDVSKISVTNVRFGINNQYYVKCHELTGFEDDFSWIDEDEVIDFALSNGVKEHRLSKFLSHITSGMIDQDKDNDEADDDVYISSGSEEGDDEEDEDEFDEDQDDYPYDSDDNLDDLIRYSKSNTQGLIPMQDRDFSNNIPAKKRRNFDNLGIGQDLQDSLIEQIINYRKNKKQQKQRNKAQQTEDAILSHDLLIKYPDSLTISQIGHEFTSFLQDESRTTLSFPTLDSHGNKTLQSMAAAYNMQTDKCGRHNVRHYIKVTKTRKTYKNIPNFNRINAIMRGRPVFHRMDVKREKKSKDSKLKRGGGGNEPRAKFKEGDVVGAEAPEIDQSNLGRIMLEKLGWSRGQGLGRGNSGINEPIVAKVKMSKTGIR
ncbi:Sqs1 protein [Candida orthopsilosis Co 90-125]|uniref:Sqs1 protein n=1 Tax=Candida orthopsilosis (strain 90-125) TaxID=1136231 RepID=H8WW01_CANO9|nr:Sqs1 protein [Candida orthopsilosis Co 90-125]CCG20625.1 Sqs1 protein [Candida orthopsilosis Co 90-125]